MTINTDTHTISAYYAVDGEIATHEISKNGYTIEEIITEMIDFANWLPGLAAAFAVESDDRTDDGFQVTIKGKFYRANEDGDLTDKTDTMTITIAGWEN